MQTLSEQMSCAGRAQVQAQLDLLGSLASAAIDNAGKLALLQLNAVRETLDRSSAMWFGMLAAGTPAYSQQQAPAPAEAGTPGRAAQAPAEPAAPAIDEPDAPRTPIAQATAQVVPASAALQPMAPTVPVPGQVELPRLRPLEADPPPAWPATGPRRKPAPRK